ncbi:MAG: hypothetical protein Q7R30_09225 [Acidobacteriota bacterium]|nr:hypothetical protein [Acidobacteriota bacterium]
MSRCAAGDAMEIRRSQLAPPSCHFTEDMTGALASIRRLARTAFDALCLSHFPPILRGTNGLVHDLTRTLEG